MAITPRFYRAAMDFDLWQGVLRDLCAVFEAPMAQVNLIDSTAQEIVAASQIGAPDGLFAAYMAFEDHIAADPRYVKSMELPNRPFTERQVMSVATWHGSQMYREVFAPFGVDSMLASYVVVEDDGASATLGFLRRRGAPDFTDADVARFHLYLPHFREAMRCAVRMHRSKAESSALAELFDGMRVAAVVTDRFDVVRHANAAARGLFEDASGDDDRDAACRRPYQAKR